MLGPFPIALQYWALVLLSGLLVGLAAQQQGFISSLGRRINTIVDWIGTRSYGLYLIHLPAMMLAGELTWRMRAYDGIWLRAAIALAVLVAATECCYRLIECPIREYGRRVAHRYRESKTFSTPFILSDLSP
jgi:peptidoglycan/LPS O-acetylase OafA/YrhL